MKKILLFLALLPVSVFGDGLTASETLDVRALQFERVGDEVLVQLALDVDGRRVGTKDRWELTPVVEAGERAEDLPPIVISGRSRSNMYRRAQKLGHSRVDYGGEGAMVDETVRRDEGRSVVYNTTLAWQPWMEGASLNLYTRLISCCSDRNMGEELLATLFPVMVESGDVAPRVSYVAPVREAEKMRAIVRTAYIDFYVNRSDIVPSLNRNSSELAAIRASIDEVHEHPDLTFKGIELTGYASPEGPYANNERLASSRVNAVMSYVVTHYGVDPHVVSTRHIAEDWAGLRSSVEGSDLRDKAAVLEIIDSERTADGREAALKTLSGGGAWGIILRDMMPPLRRTEYRIDYTVRNYDVDESRTIIKTNPELLSHYELDALARTYDRGSEEYFDIYNLIEIQNMKDDAANVDVAANYISRGHWKAAATALERVRKHDAAYWNNYGIVQMMTGNEAAAAEAFRLSGTSESQYNARLLEERQLSRD